LTEADRLEELWAGKFGDEYTERNSQLASREAFWAIFASYHPRRILEVGCNIGTNLYYFNKHSQGRMFGVDINGEALKRAYPCANYAVAEAKDLPYKDGYFDFVFTVGVLIHQPESTLPRVMGEMYRCSCKYIMSAEYEADETKPIPYRGNDLALFKRNYEKIWQELYPELELVEKGVAGKDLGFDNVTWFLWRK